MSSVTAVCPADYWFENENSLENGIIMTGYYDARIRWNIEPLCNVDMKTIVKRFSDGTGFIK